MIDNLKGNLATMNPTGTIAHLITSSPLRSQIEMSNWEFFPGVLMLLFLGAGLSHLYNQKKHKRGYANTQRSERYRMSLPLVINTPVTQEFSVRTFDVSLTGAFLPYDDLKNSMAFTSLVGKRSGIKVGDLVDIKVYIGRFSQFNCQARVIRYNFSDNNLPPKGIGIEFVNLSKKNKKLLQNLILQQKQEQDVA